MRLSTVTNIYRNDINGDYICPLYSMEKIAKLGFKVIDLTISQAKNMPNHPMNTDKWEKWVEDVGNKAAELGLEIASAHLPFAKPSDPVFDNTESAEAYERLKYRCIEACGRLGIKWGVEHALFDIEDQTNPGRTREKNKEYFTPFLEAAKKVNLGIAFENMLPPYDNKKFRLRYPVTHYELLEFVGMWNDDSVGCIWDFGHANIVYEDQYQALVDMGKKLKVTHVQDNLGFQDNHLAPYVGTVNWERAMQGLADGGYEGDLNFETGNFAANKPEKVQDILNKYCFDIGNYLLGIYEKYKKI